MAGADDDTDEALLALAVREGFSAFVLLRGPFGPPERKHSLLA